ncbi:MAG: hypothetical protein DRI90_23240 [Deltaproteobacteria bacterium]|nr:MAG: hypothetical protein DRI90_23240 [Deltaproteobacteria bacterium]
MSLREALNLDLAALKADEFEPVTVAVVDSGVDSTHEELEGRIAEAYFIEPTDDGPVLRKREGPGNHDAYGHGTAVASIVTRLAPNARIIDVAVLDGTNRCTGDILVAGFAGALEVGAKIVNLSLVVKAKFSRQLADLCEVAYRGNQVVVGARRNVPLVDDGFPALLSPTIGVDRESFANPFKVAFAGTSGIEYSAHGDNVTVAAPGGGHVVLSGTSFATPAVSAICALYLGRFPDLAAFDLKSLLKAQAEAQAAESD